MTNKSPLSYILLYKRSYNQPYANIFKVKLNKTLIMYWRFENRDPKEIEDAINNEKSTIETFLLIDDIAAEFKNNTKLAEHFNYQYVQKLIEYVTQMPKETDQDNRKYRFPFVATEILKTDCKPIANLIFSLNPEKEVIVKSPSDEGDVQIDDLNSGSPQKEENAKSPEKELKSPDPKEEAKVDGSPTIIKK